MRIKYSKKNKIKILKEIEQKLKNQSISELLEEYKIPRPTYYTWKKRYLNKNNSLQIEKTLDIIENKNTEIEFSSFDTDDKEIGLRIKKVRESMNLTVNQFIKGTGYIQQQISYFETGQRKINIHFLTLLFLKYGINPNYILLNQEPQFIFTRYKENIIKKNNF
ncbi:hypothetical protein UPTC15622_00883 [Campylobacter lari]|uniref:helix-turn-helix domain-containing protein n=2 Tax=Campylobacter lari TaxID=201 RepID=UPI001BD282AF